MATVISRKYEVVGQLGQGGMGLVYKVRHTALETISALKVLPTYLMENQDMVNRFYREARVMARLNHANIVRVLDIERDEAQDLYYFVMEYIEGVTLGKYLRDKGPLPLAEVLTISRQVADALSYAHTHTPPIIHRDIKPANIMIESRSSRVVVMDFGIAKELGDGDSTKTGTVIGTLKYASPEQLRHEPLDGSADVYSLGMVMYEMYTGKQFFGGLDEHAVLGKVLYDKGENEPIFDRPPLPAFADLLRRAMAKSRDRRYPTMRDLLRAIDACSTQDQDDEASGTVILPGPSKKDTGAKEAPADDDLEEQIRKLEEERERRRILQIQTQAREARERAAREGAAEWASTIFQQGLAAEEQGAKHLRERDFTAAPHAFEEAIQLFDRANVEAQLAATKRKVEQAKEAMSATKEEAEHYGARDLARTRFSRGLTLEAQAEELIEQNDFSQALQIYTEAARSFADARELAYRETLKQEAVKAQDRVSATRTAAEEKGAVQFAAQLFREAAVHEDRAKVAIAHEEFTQARELFLSAAQKYEYAQQQALLERQQQEAVAVQQQAREAQRHAATIRAREFASVTYEHAIELQQQGDAQLRAQSYDAAMRLYLQARDEYEHATQEAEIAQEQQATVTVRQQLQQVIVLADRVGAQKRAATAYEQAQLLVTQGEEKAQQQHYREARESYTQATQRFQQITREVAVLIAQERADSAREEMVAALHGSEGLQTRARTSWAKAQESQQQADRAYQKQEYGRAAELYAQAAQAYSKARTDSEQEQLQQEAREAQQQARTAREHADRAQADRYVADLYRQGLTAQQEAEKQGQARTYRAAIEHYQRAAALLTEAATTAQHERRKQDSVAARQFADDARRGAEGAGAGQRFANDFSRATRLVEQAEQEETQQDFVQTVEHYQAAAELWQRLAQEATREAEKEKAEAVRARIAEARAQLSGLQEWRGAKWADAERHEATANEACTTQQYTQAAEAYTRALQCYSDAYNEAEGARKSAELERQRRYALDAQQQASDAQASAEGAHAQQYAVNLYQQAVQISAQATQHIQAQRWLEARELFSEVRSLWSQAAHDAQQAQEQQAATALRQRLDTARAGAEKAEAHKRFTQEFTRAQELTEQGVLEEAQQNFMEAAHLYEQALQQLLRLRREADIQAEREQTEVVRQQTRNAKEQANALKQWAKTPWDAAQKFETEAERLFQGQDYEAALSSYERASKAYLETAETGERERLRQETAQAEKQATAARKKAQDAEALRFAATEFNQGATAVTEAEQHQQKLAFVESTQAYRRAEECFTRARTIAQQEQAKQQMQTALRAAEEASSSPLVTEAKQRLPQDLSQARALLQKGHTAEAQQDFAAARREYELAQQQFVKIAQAVQQDITREQAETAKQNMLQAKKAANTLAPNFATALWKEAQSHEAEGERARKAQTYDQACALYDRATQSYTRARSEAEEEEQRQRAATASQKATVRQKEADAIQAAQYAGEAYRKAQTVKEQAEAAFTAKKFAEAEQLFVQVDEAFTAALQAAQAARIQQRAIAAREQATTAQREAQVANSEEALPGQYAEAMSLFREAEQAFASGKFEDARERFERMAVRWQQLRQEAEVAQQRYAAETAQARANVLREQTRTSKGKQKNTAEKAIIAGDKLLQQKRYQQAEASYREAISLLSTLQQQAQITTEAKQRGGEAQGNDRSDVSPVPVTIPPSQSVPQRSTSMIAGGVALAVVAALGLYVMQPSKSEDPKGNTKTTQAEAERLKAEQAKAEAERQKAEQAKAEAERLKVEQAKAEAARQKEAQEKAAELARQKEAQEKATELARVKETQEKAAEAERQKALAALIPPKLTRLQPANAELTVAEGKSLAFSLEAESSQPQLLKFAWFVDGKKQGDGKKWNYQPGYEDGGERVREVKAVVTDGKNSPVENVWKVRVEDVNRPPAIAGATPKAGAVTISAGTEQSFSVQASDPDKDDRLVYVWSVNGEEVARGDNRNWQLPATASDASRSVKVEVFDKAGKSVQLAWNVTPKAPALPPRIVDVEPGNTNLTVDAGKSLPFTVTAELTGASSGRKELSYLWSIDDARPQRTDNGRFVFPATTSPGTYELSVTAIGPEGLQSTAKRWTITVKAVEVVRTPPPPPPPPSPPPSRGPEPPSQQEALNWLETTYRQAWESRNVDTLVQMGEISAQDAAKLKTILEAYKEYRVNFTDVNVRSDGNRAIVRFSRIDTIDGKTMRPTPPKEVTLEKGDGGRIARRR